MPSKVSESLIQSLCTASSRRQQLCVKRTIVAIGRRRIFLPLFLSEVESCELCQVEF